MIRSFRHKGLQLFFETGVSRGIQPAHARRLRLLLGRLHAAQAVRDLALPGLRLHPLQGRLAGWLSVRVNANWRLIFRFEGQDVVDLDYLDYH